MPHGWSISGSRVWIALAVGAVGAAVFMPALGGEWIYDDHSLIEQNAYLHSLDQWKRWFTTDFWDVSAEATASNRMLYWRPLVTTSYALDWQLGGGSPLMFHITNLVLHGCVAALAFVLFRRWIGSTWPAAAAAVLFAVHPTKAESVAWISGRTDVLCALFILVAAHGIARRLQKLPGGIAFEIIGTIGAYTCKEQAIVLPILAAVEMWVREDRPAVGLSTLKPMTRAAVPQLLVAVGYLAIRTLLLPIGQSTPAPGPDLVAHGQLVLETLGRFIALTFVPADSSLQHGLLLLSGGKLVVSYTHVALGAFATMAFIAVAIVLRKRRPAVTIGIGVYLLTLVPTSNIRLTSLSTLVSERFLYLPILGIAVAGSSLIASLSQLHARRAYALVAAIALSLGALSLSRSADFASEREFWAREASLHPESTAAHNFQFKIELEERRLRAALDTLMRIQRQQEQLDASTSDLLTFAHHVALVVSELLPDLDVAGLQNVDAFCRALITRNQPMAVLGAAGVRLSVPLPSALPREFGTLYAQLYALRAEINSRLGNDKAAMQLAGEARGLCPGCATFVIADALTHARANRHDEALAMLSALAEESGDPRLADAIERIDLARATARTGGPNSEAEALAILKLWGRAFRTANARRDDHLRTSAGRLWFSELAVRAGDTQTARDVLSPDLSPAQIDDTIATWLRSMGWTE